MKEERFKRMTKLLEKYNVDFWNIGEDYPKSGQLFVEAKLEVYEDINLYIPFHFEGTELIIGMTYGCF